ncbi:MULTISPECIES: DUF202 domain-containing protein [Streptococcus]|uniref:DUF202 domain-containing protein n=1 Tax=Streptococcus caledonicus TaxID=2614158 RepID=A0ABW0UH53_9STRE|nr:DUF202 domain-containing protein [Streptococcus sp. S784/96/1]
MTEQELIKGYETEIAYQKHMIENLGRWFNLLFLIASIGCTLFYFFHKDSLVWTILSGILIILGLLGMLLFGYGIYKGRRNVNRVIEDFEYKLKFRNF